jgi:hypothetical protein
MSSVLSFLEESRFDIMRFNGPFEQKWTNQHASSCCEKACAVDEDERRKKDTSLPALTCGRTVTSERMLSLRVIRV